MFYVMEWQDAQGNLYLEVFADRPTRLIGRTLVDALSHGWTIVSSHATDAEAIEALHN